MELRFRRLLFYSVWFFLLLLPFYIVFNNLDIQNLLSNSLVLINTFQRLSGSLAFVLLFSQIVIGSNMDWWVQAIGAKAYKIHITQGLCIYALVLIHPVLYLVFLHARVGTDFDSPVFYSLYLAAFFFISATLIYKLVKLLRLKDLVK